MRERKKPTQATWRTRTLHSWQVQAEMCNINLWTAEEAKYEPVKIVKYMFLMYLYPEALLHIKIWRKAVIFLTLMSLRTAIRTNVCRIISLSAFYLSNSLIFSSRVLYNSRPVIAVASMQIISHVPSCVGLHDNCWGREKPSAVAPHGHTADICSNLLLVLTWIQSPSGSVTVSIR